MMRIGIIEMPSYNQVFTLKWSTQTRRDILRNLYPNAITMTMSPISKLIARSALISLAAFLRRRCSSASEISCCRTFNAAVNLPQYFPTEIFVTNNFFTLIFFGGVENDPMSQKILGPKIRHTIYYVD